MYIVIFVWRSPFTYFGGTLCVNHTSKHCIKRSLRLPLLSNLSALKRFSTYQYLSLLQRSRWKSSSYQHFLLPQLQLLLMANGGPQKQLKVSSLFLWWSAYNWHTFIFMELLCVISKIAHSLLKGDNLIALLVHGEAIMLSLLSLYHRYYLYCLI